MITVIIAGGSGTRLWPLSTPDYPKHLLKINGSERSLLQGTYDRAKLLSDTIYITTESGHVHHVKDQLPELPEEAFIVEPARRGTASCIVAALSYITKVKSDPSEPIVFLSADHYIRDVKGFEHSFKIAAAASEKEERIVLVGAEPDHPATGFGYIKKGKIFDEETFVFNVHSHKEKPDYDTAQAYLKSGNYLWSCGYFVGSANTFKNALQRYAPGLFNNFEKLSSVEGTADYEKTYLDFENVTIDYGLIENVNDLLVVPASFDWMDLGSYGDMHKAVGSDELGNHLHGENIELENVENAFIQNHEDKPIAVIGLDNIVVVNTKDGILVSRKDLSQKVGEVSKRITSK